VHVLTKIFIVLVSLLAVLLVPLVVVYAHNENNYKSRLQQAEARAAASDLALTAAEARYGAEKGKLETDLREVALANTDLQKDQASSEATIRQLESQLATAQGMQAEIGARLASISSSVQAGQQLTESLVNELRDLRSTAVAIERQKVDLDEALRDVTSQLEIAEQARRALSEELARLKDEHASTMDQLGKAFALGYRPDDVRLTTADRIPDVSVNARVLQVQKSADQTLVEIDAGQKDGVKDGWIMSISDSGKFIATIRIVRVDVNRSTGLVTLSPGKLAVGQIASSTAGEP
jgi:hypothetical protein